jgi:hypothetical protein
MQGMTEGHPSTSDALLMIDGSENIKRCPMCHVPIERDAGCAQMMCKRCKHVFCWFCLTSLDVSSNCLIFWLYHLHHPNECFFSRMTFCYDIMILEFAKENLAIAEHLFCGTGLRLLAFLLVLSFYC